MDTDTIIEGENPLYNAIRAQEDIGKREIALHRIYPGMSGSEKSWKHSGRNKINNIIGVEKSGSLILFR